MRLVYVAGPFRGDVPRNVETALAWGRRVVRAGALAVVPHLLGREFGPVRPDETWWLKAKLELLRRCDGVLLIPGWERSSGSVNERNEALRLNLPVFDCGARDWTLDTVAELDRFEAWCRGGP